LGTDGRRILAIYSGGDQVWDSVGGRAVGPFRNREADIMVKPAFDGRLLARVEEKQLKVRDVETGAVVATVSWQGGSLLGLWFGPRGRLATVSADRKAGTFHARVWDAATGKPLSPPLPHATEPTLLLFAPQGNHLLTLEQSLTKAAMDTLRVWSLATGKTVFPPIEGKAIQTARFSPDGNRVALASGHSIEVCDATTGAPVFAPVQHGFNILVEDLGFTPDGRFLVSIASQQVVGEARVWDASSGQAVALPIKLRSPVRQLAIAPDGMRMATVGVDGDIRVWHILSGEPLTPWLPHRSMVARMQFSPDGRFLLTAVHEEAIRLWDLAGGLTPVVPLRLSEEVQRAWFSSSGRHLMTQERAQDSVSSQLRLWDTSTAQAITSAIPLGTRGPKELILCSDGRRCIMNFVATDKRAREVHVWNLAQAKPSLLCLNHDTRVDLFTLSHDERRLVTVADRAELRGDSPLFVWDLAAGTKSTVPLQGQGPVFDAALYGDRLVVCGLKTAQVLDVTTGKPLTAPLLHPLFVVRALFSRDGRRLATVCDDKNTAVSELRVWDAGTGQLLAGPLIVSGKIIDIRFCTDGGRLLSLSSFQDGDGGEARVWDVATSQPLTPPLRHSKALRGASFSPDDSLVLTAGNDGNARVWDAANGELVASLNAGR
jgi:WD40 repeat protein